ncbi:MAG: PD-(D/E)XK nuclease family protein [Planctomycetota bacterium]
MSESFSRDSPAADVQTLHLGWDAPLLPRVAMDLCQRYGRQGALDLSGLLIVLPSARAVSRLLELLYWEAEEKDLEFQSPNLITIGQLPESLYAVDQPIAAEFEETLAWAQVLQARSPDDLEPLTPNAPDPDAVSAWLEIAGMLRRLYGDLASEGMSFDGVRDLAETDAERRRWTLLSELLSDYHQQLNQAHLLDLHQSRWDAVRQGRVQCDKTIVLVATADLPPQTSALLKVFHGKTLAYVAAPASAASRFDPFGNLTTSAWAAHQLPLQDQQLIAAGSVTDQATAVAEQLSDLGTRFSADQITIGITDPSQLGPLEVELRGCGVATYRHLGWSIAETSIGRLIQLTRSHLQSGSWRSLAALARHALVHQLVSETIAQQSAMDDLSASQWHVQMDAMIHDHHPVGIQYSLPPRASETYPLAVQAAEVIGQWLGPLRQADQSIGRWCEVLLEWIKPLKPAAHTEDACSQPDLNLASSSRTPLAVSKLTDLLQRLSDLNPRLDRKVGGAVALEMIASRMADIRVNESARPGDVEVLGWLDLALDDAPAMVVTGLNHPFVPEAVTSDPFLPGTLRSRLRISDNERRLARDIYAMQLILSSRTAVRFIVGRQSADGSPTPPSRLLAAAPPAGTARWIRNLFDQERTQTSIQRRWDTAESQPLLKVPTLDQNGDYQPVTTLSVTALKDYLTCPYRFYLRHVLRLRPIDDASQELAANQFGDLVHGALERFGQSDQRNEASAAKIESLLLAHLDAFAEEHYGHQASAAVRLQIEQARQRLRTVALRQAQRVAEGWLIHAAEIGVDEKNVDSETGQPKRPAGIEVDGQFMGIRGRFDRIDYHPTLDRWAILDYKTHGHPPEKKHLERTGEGYRWIDLQLPLYRRMIPFLGIEADPATVQLGYFNVSAKESETRINVADFTEFQMQQASELIETCIRRIFACDFRPTEDRVPYDDYGMILQTSVTERRLDESLMQDIEEMEAIIG